MACKMWLADSENQHHRTANNLNIIQLIPAMIFGLNTLMDEIIAKNLTFLASCGRCISILCLIGGVFVQLLIRRPISK